VSVSAVPYRDLASAGCLLCHNRGVGTHVVVLLVETVVKLVEPKTQQSRPWALSRLLRMQGLSSSHEGFKALLARLPSQVGPLLPLLCTLAPGHFGIVMARERVFSEGQG
jgi:hypothetical protein